jgi:2-polyprenyl-3-methyl-5-hydroxy-6-metoxy-1,4-benzoquinol methylase
MSTWRADVEADCTICRGTDRRAVHVIDGHQIVRCTRCGHLYVSPRPPMEDVVAIYGDDYFENPAFRTTDHEAYFGYMDYLNDRENIQIRLRQVLGRIAWLHGAGRLLDVGCGPGLFLEVGDRAGWESWGVDLNKSAIDWARDNVSENVRVGTVSDLGAEPESFACVTMFDVIEHLADPRAELQEVWRILEPGGILVVATPDAGALMSRLLGSHWLEMKRAPEHLHFFSVQGMAKLLDLSGFTPSEWHSIGKVTTMRNILADLRFYSDGFFGGVEKAFERIGLADRVFDVDPRTKLCMYARKTKDPVPLEEFDSRPPPAVPKIRTLRIRSRDVLSVRAQEQTPG